MKLASTLSVISILSAMFVAAIPVPAEVDVAYEVVTAREITDMALDEIFERSDSARKWREAAAAALARQQGTLRQAWGRTADTIPKKAYDALKKESRPKKESSPPRPINLKLFTKKYRPGIGRQDRPVVFNARLAKFAQQMKKERVAEQEKKKLAAAAIGRPKPARRHTY